MSSRPAPSWRRSAKTEYIETDTGNKIFRRAHIEGKQNIMLGGKSVIMAGVHLRGDLHRIAPPPPPTPPPAEGERAAVAPAAAAAAAATTAISIGKACVISANCVLHPPMRVNHGEMTFYPVRIGDNVFVGTGTVISSVQIGSHVHVGEGCVLGSFSVLKENCKVLPGTVVPPHMVVAPGSVVAGRPARIVGEVGDAWGYSVGGDGEDWVEGGDLRPLVRAIK